MRKNKNSIEQGNFESERVGTPPSTVHGSNFLQKENGGKGGGASTFSSKRVKHSHNTSDDLYTPSMTVEV